MKIGVSLSLTDTTVDIVTLARKCEELGFESLWMPEHTAIPVHVSSPWVGSADGSIPEDMAHIVDPFIALAHASAVTTTLNLGTSVCLVPERNPIVLAKEIASLDYFSKGRVLFGIGSGWLKEETELYGIRFEDRAAVMRENILAMKALWTNNEAEFHGKFVDFPAIKVYPKPVRQPHPPIFLGGRAKNVFRRIVAWGDGWMPTRTNPEEIEQGRREIDRLAQAAGRDPSSIEVMVHGQTGDPELLRDFENAGAERAMIGLPRGANEASALTALEEIAGKVLT
jgi:probable F420-dependent oxidoreductase